MKANKEKRKEILEYVIKTSFDGKRIKLGKKIEKEILTTCDMMDNTPDLRERGEIIKECYSLLQKDSTESLANAISILTLILTATSLLPTLEEVVIYIIKMIKARGVPSIQKFEAVDCITDAGIKSLCGERCSGFFDVCVKIVGLIFCFFIFGKIMKIVKESTQLRNNLIAITLLMHEDKERQDDAQEETAVSSEEEALKQEEPSEQEEHSEQETLSAQDAPKEQSEEKSEE